MGCTIGWIKTEKGYILFKNRDLSAKNPIFSNMLRKSEKDVIFSDRKLKGTWFAINKQGIGIVSADGPYKEGKESESFKRKIQKEAFDEITKRGIKSVDEATELYKKICMKEEIYSSANIILCNNKRANVIEIAPDKVNIAVYHDKVFRTNHFFNMKEFNEETDSLKRSIKRLKKIDNLAKDVKKPEEIISILKYHSKDSDESICRHGKSTTMASVVAEYVPNKVNLNYVLNKHPCEAKEYSNEVVEWNIY